MQIKITTNNNEVHLIALDSSLTINGEITNTVEKASDALNRLFDIKNSGVSSHMIPVFFRTDTAETHFRGFDCRTLASFEIVPV
jgi:hypothetical protein